jgi:hypothetical protein
VCIVKGVLYVRNGEIPTRRFDPLPTGNRWSQNLPILIDFHPIDSGLGSCEPPKFVAVAPIKPKHCRSLCLVDLVHVLEVRARAPFL